MSTVLPVMSSPIDPTPSKPSRGADAERDPSAFEEQVSGKREPVSAERAGPRSTEQRTDETGASPDPEPTQDPDQPTDETVTEADAAPVTARRPEAIDKPKPAFEATFRAEPGVAGDVETATATMKAADPEIATARPAATAEIVTAAARPLPTAEPTPPVAAPLLTVAAAETPTEPLTTRPTGDVSATKAALTTAPTIPGTTSPTAMRPGASASAPVTGPAVPVSTMPVTAEPAVATAPVMAASQGKPLPQGLVVTGTPAEPKIDLAATAPSAPTAATTVGIAPKLPTMPGLAASSVATAPHMMTTTLSGSGDTPVLGLVPGDTSSVGQFTNVTAPTAVRAPQVAVDAAVLQQVGDAIRLHRSDQTVSLRLDPPELGRVAIDLTFDGQKLVSALLSAENGDTGQLLRRQQEALARELAAAGFDGVSVDVGDSGGDWEQDFDRAAPVATPSPVQLTNAMETDAIVRQPIFVDGRIDARF